MYVITLTCVCRIEGHYTWKQYWNYLRRQLYVMDTYATNSNKHINHSLMVIHSYLSWAVVVPATTGSIQSIHIPACHCTHIPMHYVL